MNHTVLSGFFTCLLISMLTGCNNSSDIHTESETSVFTLSGIISPVSKAPQLNADGAGVFTDGDQNRVFILSEGESIMNSFLYTYGQKYYWGDLPLTSQSDNLSISACYPAIETDSPDHFEWDTKDSHNLMVDFLYAIPANVRKGTTVPIELTFNHALHKLKINIQADGKTMTDEQIAGIVVKCRDVQPIAHLNLLKGKVISASGQLCNFESKGPKTEFIIPAQEIGTMNLLIQLGNREQVYDLSKCSIDGTSLTKLESGKCFVFNLTVSQKEFIITGQEISGWENQGEIDDSIMM